MPSSGRSSGWRGAGSGPGCQSSSQVVAAGAVVFRRADARDAVSTSRMVVAPVLAKSSRRITSARQHVQIRRFHAHHPASRRPGQGIFFWCGRGLQRPAVISRGFTCSPLPSSSCCRPLSTSNRRAGRCSACRASGWRQPRGKSAVCGILIERFIERSRCDITCAAKAENERPASGSRLRRWR